MALPIDTIRGYLRTAALAEGMTFNYGTEADDFLTKLTTGADLTGDGHFLLVDTTDGIKRDVEGWELIPCRAMLVRQTRYGDVLNTADVQDGGTARIDLRTAMYDQWIDIIEYIRANNSAVTDIQDDWEYSFISYGDNVCEGVLVNFNMYVNSYC